jgi:hypothetical protein
LDMAVLQAHHLEEGEDRREEEEAEGTLREKNKIIAVSSRIFFYVWSATQSETITSS